MYKIGELSRLCRIPVKTLRYYDNEGVLVPDEIDRFTGAIATILPQGLPIAIALSHSKSLVFLWRK